MESRWITILRDLTPPLAWRGVRTFLQAVKLYEPPVIEERDSAWYDRAFKESATYHLPYRQSPYYFLWCVLVDRLIRSGSTSVLDIGCGPGQVASFLRDKGLKRYVGIDVSPVATKMAKSLCPDFDFVTASAFDTDVFSSVKYDTVICMEFLEHVTDDIRVLKRIERGTRVFGTVPNFPYTAHVRFFSSCDEVSRRYGGLFDTLSVDAIESPGHDTKFFLLDGTKL